jgi:hypothetical protein
MLSNEKIKSILENSGLLEKEKVAELFDEAVNNRLYLIRGDLVI